MRITDIINRAIHLAFDPTTKPPPQTHHPEVKKGESVTSVSGSDGMDMGTGDQSREKQRGQKDPGLYTPKGKKKPPPPEQRDLGRG